MQDFKLSFSTVYFGNQQYPINGLPETLDHEQVIRVLVQSVANLTRQDIEINHHEANQFHGDIISFSAFGNAVAVTYKKEVK